MSGMHEYTTNPETLSSFPAMAGKERAAGVMTAGPMGMNFDHPSTLVHGHMPGKRMMDGSLSSVPHMNQQLLSGKPVLEVIPKNGITRSMRESPCHELPCYLVPNNFVAKQPHYPTVQTQVEVALSLMQEKYPSCLDYGYFASQCQWRLKYLTGSDLREIHINCYWDSNIQDHVLEMNRVKGDGLFPSTNEFYEILRQKVLGEHYTPPKIVPGRRPMMPGPPPLLLKRGGSSGSGSSMPLLPSVTEEMFVKGIKPIFSMAEDNFFEPRLEAAKSLCDLSKRDVKLLSLAYCQDNVIRCLNALLQDEFDDIRQFAVMACAMFAKVDGYKALLLKMECIHILVQLVLQAPIHHEIAYETAQMRRQACVTLNQLIHEDSLKIRKSFEDFGVMTVEELQRRCSSHLPHGLVNELESCFEDDE